MFNEELMKHVILYIEDHPQDVRLDDYREDTRILVTGRLGIRDDYRRGSDAFQLSFIYNKDGDLKNMNGMEFKFDTTPLRDAFSKAIVRNFKLKKKMSKIKGIMKGKRK